jgi:hypothetical protein
MYSAPPILKHCANGLLHQGPWFLHISHVYDLALLFAWVGMVWVPSSASSHIEKEEPSTTICDHATAAATPKLPSICAASKYTQVRAKVTQCSPIICSFLSQYELSWSYKYMPSLFISVCSGLNISQAWDIHRLFKLSMVLRLKCLL